MERPRNYQGWADVAVLEELNDGQMLAAFLQAQRLEARTYDDKLFRYLLFLRPPRVTYRVQVRKNAFRAATEFLERNAPAILEKAIHCPSCGSLRVNYPQMTRKFFTPTVLLHFGLILRLIDHECYCESCHYDWNLSLLEKSDFPASKVSSH